MSTQVQYRRGTDTQNNSFTGALAEITVNTTDWTLRVHDGVTAGGAQALVGNSATQTLTNKTLGAFTVAGNITGNLLPSSNTAFNLGSNTQAWNSLYVAGNTIYLGALQLKDAGSNTFAIYTADGTTQANIDVGSIDVSSITQGNSSIGIAAPNGNAFVTVGGNANVLLITSTGVSTTGTFSSTGNTTVGNLGTSGNLNAGNISTTGLIFASGNVTGDNFFINGHASATGNITSVGNVITGNLETAGLITATGNITAGNLITGGLLSVTGTINTLGNISTNADITANGTISVAGTATLGNVSTGGTLSATGNANVGNLGTTGVFATTLSASGNANIGNLGTVGVFATTLSASGNANIGNLGTVGVFATTLSASGNVDAGNLSGTNITGTLTTNAQPNITSVGTLTSLSVSGTITGGNLDTTGTLSVAGTTTTNAINSTGQISTTGNIVASNITGTLTTNAQPNITSVGTLTSLSVSGTITGGNVSTAGSLSATGNATVGNLSAGGAIIATGNIVGGNIIANALIESATVSATGTVTAGNIVTTGSLTATGNIQSNGTVYTNTISSVSGALTASTNSGDLVLSPSGNIDASNNYINNLLVPVQASDAATKEYVDNAVSTGITIHDPVLLESPIALNATYAQGGNTYTVNQTIAGNTVVFSTAANVQPNDQLWFSNSFEGIVGNTAYFVVSAPNTSAAVLSLSYSGTPVNSITSNTGLTESVRVNSGVGATLTNAGANATLQVDGVTVANTNRILVYQQANAAHNGVYVVTEAGNATTAWQLTRSTDMNKYAADDIDGMDAGDYFYVQSGDTGAGESYVMTDPVGPFVIGYDNLTFTQFSASQVYSANTSAGLSLSGTVFSAKVDNDTTAFSSGNIVVKAGANLTTPNIGAATGTSLSLTGTATVGNVSTVGTISATGNITGGNINLVSGTITLANSSEIKDTAGNALAIGKSAGTTSQSASAVAIGYGAGSTTQGSAAIAIGLNAGAGTQGINGIALGEQAAFSDQLSDAIAIGRNAGYLNQGTAAIAIGVNAGQTSQANNSIIINASGSALNQTVANTFTVAPVRNDVSNIGQILFYNTSSKEVTYGNTVSVSGNITGGNASITGNISSTTASQDTNTTQLATTAFVLGQASSTTPTSIGTNTVGTGTTFARADHTHTGVASLANGGGITASASTGAITLGSTATNSNTAGAIVARDGSGNFSAGTITATLSGAATTAGTVTTAAQGNITSVGTLTSLSLSGLVTGATSASTDVNTANDLGSFSARGNATTVASMSFHRVGAYAINMGLGTDNVFRIGGWSASTNALQLTGTGALSVLSTISAGGNITGANIVTSGSGGNITGANVVSATTILTSQIQNSGSNGVGNIGNSTTYFNTVFAKATSAQYADLAEAYAADAEYPPGTVLVFGGNNEVTISTVDGDTAVAGVVSTNPAHVMNSGLNVPNTVVLALTGRVPTRVVGPVRKGQMMISAENGYARACATPAMGSVIGKALENFDGDRGVIEVVVGRL